MSGDHWYADALRRPQVGQRWRVTLEGVIADDDFEVPIDRHFCVKIRAYDDGIGTMTLPMYVGVWEKLADPEPDYPIGTAWKSERDGLIYVRAADGDWFWNSLAGMRMVGYEKPLRPLTPWPVVPESSPR